MKRYLHALRIAVLASVAVFVSGAAMADWAP